MTNKLIAECCDRVGEVYASPEPRTIDDKMRLPVLPGDFGIPEQHWKAAKAYAEFLVAERAEAALRAQGEVTHEALTDKIASMLSLTYHYTHVWSAWNAGTISPDDFEPVDESDTPSEIATEILAMLAAPHPHGEEHGQG